MDSDSEFQAKSVFVSRRFVYILIGRLPNVRLKTTTESPTLLVCCLDTHALFWEKFSQIQNKWKLSIRTKVLEIPGNEFGDRWIFGLIFECWTSGCNLTDTHLQSQRNKTFPETITEFSQIKRVHGVTIEALLFAVSVFERWLDSSWTHQWWVTMHWISIAIDLMVLRFICIEDFNRKNYNESK